MTADNDRTLVVYLELTTPAVPEAAPLFEQSHFLSAATSYPDLRGYAVIAPGHTKDESLGTLFSGVEKLPSGEFSLELAVVLPDFFPNLRGNPEYSLPVTTESGTKSLCISNMMARVRYVKGGANLHAIVPRRVLPKLRAGEISFIPPEHSVELLRTVVSCRFIVTAESAEEAFECNCMPCVHEMIERLNLVLKALPFALDGSHSMHAAAYTRASLSHFYFMVYSDSTKHIAHGWFSPHISRTMLNPPNLSDDSSTLLEDLLSGKTATNDIDSILHSVRSHIDSGHFEYVLLLSVIAAEVATQRFVTSQLVRCGVSKSKLSDFGKDVGYGTSANIILPAAIAPSHSIDPHLLGLMNRARTLRNNYMHSGTIPKDHNEIIDLYESTKVYVSRLREIEADIERNMNTGSTSPA